MKLLSCTHILLIFVITFVKKCMKAGLSLYLDISILTHMNYFSFGIGKHTEEVLLSTVYIYRNADTFEFTMRPVNVIILKKLIKSKSFFKQTISNTEF